MIDTHCHLTDPRLNAQLPDVLARAADSGVDRFITIGTTLDDARRCVALCRQHSNIRCAIGIHPNYSRDAEAGDVDAIAALQADESVVALGEMGLDYHHAFAPRPRQATFFESQLQHATNLNRPVVIHCRDACDDCLAIMRRFPAVRAVFHCFTGSAAEARKILDAGYYLGFTGAVTFKNASGLRDAVALTPTDRMLIETDAPYLTPEPLRKQKTNEPALVRLVAEKISELKQIPLEAVDAATRANARTLFGWPD